MKPILFILLISLCFQSCADVIGEEAAPAQEASKAFSKEKKSRTSSIEAVVKFKSNLTERSKAEIRSRNGVLQYENCHCYDGSIEKWMVSFNPNDGSIEERVKGLKSDSGLESAEYNHLFQNVLGRQGVSLVGGSAYDKIVPQDKGPTIAIIDSGIDYNFHGFPRKYLAQIETDCDIDTAIYGWDFVNDDNDPADDHGHGTTVASLIIDQLTTTPFQILPLKAFDADGTGEYFDIICATGLSSETELIEFVQMSFGWYDEELIILEEIIKNTEDKIFITSAGNNGSNNDLKTHYPSNYELENLLSVAALADSYPNEISLASFSNYGDHVDFATSGENISFESAEGIFIPLSGTSFSAASATGLLANAYDQTLNVEENMSNFHSFLKFSETLSTIKSSSYLPLD